MQNSAPAPPWSATTDQEGTLCITIPTPRRPVRSLVFGLLTLGFGGGYIALCGVAVAIATNGRQDDLTALQLPVAYFPSVALPALVFAVLFLWHLGGREVIYVGDDELTTRKFLLGFGSVRTFDRCRIEDLVVAMDRSGGICIRHDKGLHRFARGLGFKERQAILAAINQRLSRADFREEKVGGWLGGEAEDHIAPG